MIVVHVIVWTLVVVVLVDAAVGRRHRRRVEADERRRNLLREVRRHGHPSLSDSRLSTLDPEGTLHDDVL